MQFLQALKTFFSRKAEKWVEATTRPNGEGNSHGGSYVTGMGAGEVGEKESAALHIRTKS